MGICGTDYHIFEGKHPYLEYPRVMGHELAVEVIEAPPGSELSVAPATASSIHISPADIASPAAGGKPNCVRQHSVLGVHRDGGMTERLSRAGAQI